MGSGDPQLSSPPDDQYPLAFIILAHSCPEQLVRLIARLSAVATDTVIVHFDARADDAAFAIVTAAMSQRHNVIFSPRHACYWADFSLVEATEKALHTLDDSGRPWLHVTLLSGVDYPIKPIHQLRAFLEKNRDTDFIEAFDLALEPFFITGMRGERTEYRWPPFVLQRGPYATKIWSMLQHFLDRRRLPPPGLQLVAGSQWWTLTPAATQTIRAHLAVKDIRQFYQTTFVPDELAFQTALMNSPRRNHVKNHNLLEIGWSSSGTPHILTMSNFDRLRASPHFFARKLDQYLAPDLLDHIDLELLCPTPVSSLSASKGDGHCAI